MVYHTMLTECCLFEPLRMPEVDFSTLRKQQTSGVEMVKAMSGKKNGLNIMMPLVKRISGLTNGAQLIQGPL